MNARKPDWLKTKTTIEPSFRVVREILSKYGLYTVCDGARCPNKSECWGCGTATFMILGQTCTRACRFCAVKKGKTGDELNPYEPENLKKAVTELGLKYVVLTSVDRDDLDDKGASHFAECIKKVKETGAKTEALIPDYLGYELETVLESAPDVLSHNIEVVKRLQNLRDSRASYEKSLKVLRKAKEYHSHLKTKSSIMLGLGETEDEILQSLEDLRSADCDMLVLGQYLQPTKKQIPVLEYIKPEKFQEYTEKARKKGFKKIVSLPLARTSYHAEKHI
jgi:lipoyl synthase